MKVTKKEAGPAALGQGHRTPAARRHVLEGGGRILQQRDAFKLTARDERGVIVTVIADNYFGYCKKEVKTQISYAANLYGLCEEEHAGGALVYASYDLGEEFYSDKHVQLARAFLQGSDPTAGPRWNCSRRAMRLTRSFRTLFMCRRMSIDLQKQTVSWPVEGGKKTHQIAADKIYVRPSGYKVQMEKPAGSRAWRLVGTVAEGTLCHKPCTVSGGGKSEISKSISDAILHGPVFVRFQKGF